MEYTEYQTREGQRWDTIAYEVYNNAYGYEPIIQANPDYRSLAILPAGVLLRIPVVQQTVRQISPEKLPPWRR